MSLVQSPFSPQRPMRNARSRTGVAVMAASAAGLLDDAGCGAPELPCVCVCGCGCCCGAAGLQPAKPRIAAKTRALMTPLSHLLFNIDAKPRGSFCRVGARARLPKSNDERRE